MADGGGARGGLSGCVIDGHVHVGLRGDSFGLGAFSDRMMASPAFDVFLAFARLKRRDVSDARLHQATLETLGSSTLDRVVCLALDPVYEPGGTRREDRSHMWVANEYVERLRRELPAKVLYGASVHPHRASFADDVRRCVDRGAVILKWLPSAQAIDLADPEVGTRMRELAHLGAGGGPLPLLLHTGAEYAIPPAEPELASLDYLSWTAWEDFANRLRGGRALRRPRVGAVRANLRAAAAEGAVIVFAHVGLPYFTPGLLGRLIEHSDLKPVAELLERGREVAGDERRYFADVSACCTPFRAPFFPNLAALPSDALLLGSDFPTPVFELFETAAERLRDLRQAVEEGRLERLLVPDGNPLDVNCRTLREVFRLHPLFTNLGRLLDRLGLCGAPAPDAAGLASHPNG